MDMEISWKYKPYKSEVLQLSFSFSGNSAIAAYKPLLNPEIFILCNVTSREIHCFLGVFLIQTLHAVVFVSNIFKQVLLSTQFTQQY